MLGDYGGLLAQSRASKGDAGGIWKAKGGEVVKGSVSR
jgi:hypothetical protein